MVASSTSPPFQMRVHLGHEGQEPDPLIAAKEAGDAPAYRGLAYVVFERFPLADTATACRNSPSRWCARSRGSAG
jgi:hypothetical protein